MHEIWLDQLPYYVAGTLDPAGRAALEMHLRECEACRAALAQWEAIAGAVREDAASRVEALPPLRLPDVFSGNGRVSEAPSHIGKTLTSESTEDSPMTVHVPEMASLRPAPQSRSVLTLAAAVLLVVLFGAAAILLAGRLGGVDAPGASGPDGEQPAGLGIQPGTPTPYPQATPAATGTALPGAVPPAAGAPEAVDVTPTATPIPAIPGGVVLPPTALPYTQSEVLPFTPGLTTSTTSITSVPLDLGLPPRAEIEGVRFEAQTWNNSGPATLSMALSALGWEGDQAEAAAWLRADADDRSVMLWEMALYVEQETEFGALYRVGGVPALLKRLVAYGFPVVIPVGFEADDGEWYGHHWLVAGYDDEAQMFLVYDSFLGAGEDGPREVSYNQLDAAWRQFNRAFLIVYRPEDRAEALDELAHYADRATLRVLGPSLADGYRMQHPDDPWAWFNLGAAWADLGDYGAAAAAFDKAFEMGLPWRTLWYRPEPYAAYYGAGRLSDVIRLADEQSQAGFFEEVAYWRGMVYATQGLPDLARREFQSVLDANPNYLPARVALDELTLAELDVPVFPAGRRAVALNPSLYSIVESQGVPPTPIMREELAVPPLPVTLDPAMLSPGAVITVEAVPLTPSIIPATPTPIPAD